MCDSVEHLTRMFSAILETISDFERVDTGDEALSDALYDHASGIVARIAALDSPDALPLKLRALAWQYEDLAAADLAAIEPGERVIASLIRHAH